MNIFVTGTDTNVGKTVASTILALKFGYRYWKPIQCGSLEFSDTDWVKQYIGAEKIQKEAYRFHDSLSPHLAARNEGKQIALQDLIEQFPNEKTIIEGAGGLMVPINSSKLLIDFIPKNQCKIVLIARSSLGTINHTLLSIEALRKRKLALKGVIIIGDINSDNKDSIEEYGQTKVLGEIPFLEKINLECLSKIALDMNLEI